MKIKVTSMSGHRIDVMIAEWAKRALLLVGEEIVEDDSYDVIIVTNGFLNDRLVMEMTDAQYAIYMWDDYDLPVTKNTGVICQAKNGWGRLDTEYFPIAQLAVFDKLWDKPIAAFKYYDLVYGGTYKKIREEQYKKHIPNNPTTLLIGNDKEWDAWDKTTRLPTIKNMDALYKVMAMATYTLILEDPKHNGVSVPLRYYEAKFCNISALPVSDKVFGNMEVTHSLDKLDVATRFKETIWKLI